MAEVDFDIKDALDRITYNDNIVRQWIVDLYNDKKDVNVEIEETKKALSSERTRLKNTNVNEQLVNHACNIANLEEYLRRLNTMKKNIKDMSNLGVSIDEFYQLGQSLL